MRLTKLQVSDETKETASFLLLTLIAMFRARREDCQPSGSICKGIFWLGGFPALFAVHYAAFAAAGVQLIRHGHGISFWLCLSPVLAVWLLFGGADVKFRLQRPTPEERGAFDDIVLNWFGAWSFYCGGGMIAPLSALFGLLALVRWLSAALPSLF